MICTTRPGWGELELAVRGATRQFRAPAVSGRLGAGRQRLAKEAGACWVGNAVVSEHFRRGRCHRAGGLLGWRRRPAWFAPAAASALAACDRQVRQAPLRLEPCAAGVRMVYSPAWRKIRMVSPSQSKTESAVSGAGSGSRAHDVVLPGACHPGKGPWAFETRRRNTEERTCQLRMTADLLVRLMVFDLRVCEWSVW